MQIAAGIYWIKGLKANMDACVDGDEVTRIDTGRASMDRVDQLFNNLERLRLYPANVRRILLTSAGPDYAGNGAGIVAETGVIVMCLAGVRDRLTTAEQTPGGGSWTDRLHSLRRRRPAVAEAHIRLARRHQPAEYLREMH